MSLIVTRLDMEDAAELKAGGSLVLYSYRDTSGDYVFSAPEKYRSLLKIPFTNYWLIRSVS